MKRRDIRFRPGSFPPRHFAAAGGAICGNPSRPANGSLDGTGIFCRIRPTHRPPMTVRKSIFWLHLATGLTVGLVVAVMSFTGTALAFEHDIIARVERDALRVTPPPANAPRLPVSELIKHARIAEPNRRPTAVTVSSDPAQVVQVAFGREATLYVDPYSGAVREQGSKKWRAFFQLMEGWHRFLGRSGDQRALGKAVTGACNAAFLFLALSGLVLWWPRKWRTKGLKRSLWFLRDASGRARDWNWHNVIGFWFAPILIILTATGVVMSYRWANDLVYRATGSPVPAQQGPGNPGSPALAAAKAPAAEGPLGPDALLAAARQFSPRWEVTTLLLGGPRGKGGDQRPAGETRPSAGQTGAEHLVTPPAVIMVQESGAGPLFARTSLTLDPFSAELLKRDTYADGSLGRRVRTWIRFLHTGEALGPVGQLLAALASLGAGFLVYTGFALSWRRFFLQKEEKPAVVS